MTSALLVAALNILFSVYCVRKRWFLVAVANSLSSLLLAAFVLASSEQPWVVDGLVGLLGAEAYNVLREFLLVMASEALSPYLAIALISFFAIIVVTLQTAERIIRFVLSGSSTDYDRSGHPKQQCLHLPRFILSEKKYLFYCEMLC